MKTKMSLLRRKQNSPKVMYYRRRILLALLALNNGKMEKLRMQKMLFLFTRQQTKPAYDFLPYKYGCYSFQANQDATILAEHYGLLTMSENHYLLNNNTLKAELKDEDSERLEDLFKQYGNLKTNELIYHVYKNYPWYAINSELIDKKPFAALRDNINKEKNRLSNHKRTLFTIGYEGISIERYMTLLIENTISMLVDVRHNPFSMKYGFSKKQLQHICNECDIQYLHIPKLGIAGSLRKNLVSRADYDHLFRQYRESLLGKKEEIYSVQNMLNKHRRIALTCFEKEHIYCHRNILSEIIHTQCGIDIKHLYDEDKESVSHFRHNFRISCAKSAQPFYNYR